MRFKSDVANHEVIFSEEDISYVETKPCDCGKEMVIGNMLPTFKRVWRCHSCWKTEEVKDVYMSGM